MEKRSICDGVEPLNAERFTHISPVDDHRHNVLFYTFHVAMQFAWFHEADHALSGHLDFIAHEGGRAYCNELAQMQSRTNDTIGLELDADNGALSVLAVNIAVGNEVAAISLPEGYGLQHRLNLFMFAVAVVLWLWSVDWSNNELVEDDASHPHPRLRFHNAMWTLDQLGQTGRLSGLDAREAIYFAFDQIVLTYAKMSILGIFGGLANDGVWQDSFQRISKIWELLLPLKERLKSYEFVPSVTIRR